jgi:hypothetical protein
MRKRPIPQQNDYALQLLARVCKADLTPSTALDLEGLTARSTADAA